MTLIRIILYTLLTFLTPKKEEYFCPGGDMLVILKLWSVISFSILVRNAVPGWFGNFFLPSLGPGSALGEKGEKKLACSVAVVLGCGGGGGGRVEEPVDIPLMLPIHPPAINLSLKCQHVMFSALMSTWVYYFVFVKKNLNSHRWIKKIERDLLNSNR